MTDSRAVVPLFGLTRSLRDMRAELTRTFERIVDRGEFTLGRDLLEFEERFAAFCGAEHCVGVSDGTTALRLALLALGAQPGGQVTTVPNTFVATVEAIDATGGRPALIDVDPVTRCMDPARLANHLTGDTVAVVPVHLYGRMVAMDKLCALCRPAGVRVLEDAAHAHGAVHGGGRAGAWGDAAAFSFYPTKNLGAFGDAGAVLCQEGEIAETVRSLRHHGSAPGDANQHVRAGSTARLDNLQAALLKLRLLRLEDENALRRRAAELYREILAGLPIVLPPADAPDAASVYHLFVVEAAGRDRVRAALSEAGIATGVHYPTPIHLQPAWRGLGYARGDFPVAERLAERCLSLPCFPGITEGQQMRVATALRAALGHV